MFRAMAFKELREIRGLVVAAMVIYGIIVIGGIDPRSSLNLFKYLSIDYRISESIPFVRGTFEGKFVFFAAVLAITFGLWQTFGESLRSTYPFLLHRPANLHWIMGMKLFAGLAVYLLASSIPLVIYSIWAATPGNHSSPFERSMTLPSWITLLAMTMLYLGAFLTGIMPGPWYRARFLPLAAAIFASVVLVSVVNTVFEGDLWPCFVVLAVDIWLINMILFVAKSRDYS